MLRHAKMDLNQEGQTSTMPKSVAITVEMMSYIALCEIRFRTVTGLRTVVAKSYNLRPRGRKWSSMRSTVPGDSAGGQNWFRKQPVFTSPPSGYKTKEVQAEFTSVVSTAVIPQFTRYPPASVEELDTSPTTDNRSTAAGRKSIRLKSRLIRAEVINRLQQQQPQLAVASVSHAPPTETQGNSADPILAQASKAPIHQSEAPFECEVDPTALKINKLEKLLKRAQGVKSIPDLEDGYTESAVILLERFKMPRIDCLDGSGDPMVHLHLFSDILRLMGLTTAQKLSLFGRTMSGIAAIWYAKLEDSIEVTTRDLELTRREPKEGSSEFVTRWRAKASMMTTRPSDKDQIRMIVRNLHGKLLQKMVVLPLFTFPALHEMGVQIEDAIRQGIFVEDNEPLTKNVARNSNGTTDGSTAVKCSEVDSITTSLNDQKPATSTRPQARKFHPLYMILSQALEML
ncbi:hypothetical protein HYC85_029247 [Camellia sinensis]|uniref:Retrotransposon gag domain-containing protein n=1 Tax=Camellia sinensis TaxID=4442 RepID=A0A7J7G1H5_CAMSI|nr:hypothetical protein HYC85_029247 [Camellia sinensis]